MSTNIIYLVDDDDAVRKSLIRSLTHQGYQVEAYSSGTVFLENADLNCYGCIILDVAMPNISGLEVQTELSSRGCQIPIIFITGHGDVPTSVRALRSGAIELLLERVEEALGMDEQRREDDQFNDAVRVRFETLTKREKDVLVGLVAGFADRSNKEIARELDISHRTVEEYRARIMTKMEASSITHLVEMAKACGIYKNLY